jgi:histidyl-tRNA synthetase
MFGMRISTQPYKGARDFYPADKRLQQWMFSIWKSVVERYGYEEYDAPILEPTDLYLIKGNQEIISDQTYTFKDRGDRSVTIRTEMTPSVSRMIAGRRQELSYPARWYSIPNFWRYERMQRGRLREFWQLNVDMFGVGSIKAELEMLQLTDDLFRAFKASQSSYVIKINSRVLVNTMFEFVCELDEEQTMQMIRLTDRKDKMSAKDFDLAVNEVTGDTKITKLILKLLHAKTIEELPDELSKSPSVQELQSLLEHCKSLGIRNVEFDITLMRGFDYYTDIVFEAFDTNSENNRALLGGGRYDGLIAQFGVDTVPTVGFGMGDVTFMNFLETHKLIPKLTHNTHVMILLRDNNFTENVEQIANELREKNLNVAVDYSGKKFDKQYRSVVKTGIKFALFVGSDEHSTGQYVLKNLESGKEQKHTLKRIADIIADSQK